MLNSNKLEYTLKLDRYAYFIHPYNEEAQKKQIKKK